LPGDARADAAGSAGNDHYFSCQSGFHAALSNPPSRQRNLF
jgi:hypothetical protein